MDISIATARPATQEANSVRSLIPLHLRDGAENFIGFLEHRQPWRIHTDIAQGSVNIMFGNTEEG